jgi:hypothetical protein
VAFLLLLASALSFVGACIGFALESFWITSACGLLCIYFFIASNRLERRAAEAKMRAEIAAGHIPDLRRQPLPGAANPWNDFFVVHRLGNTVGPSWVAYSWYWWAGFALAFAIPESLVAHSTHVRSALDSMAEWIPAMDRYARISSSPDLIRAWLGCMWLLMPFATLYHVMCPWTAPQMLKLQTMTWREIVIVFVLVPGGVLLMLSLTFWFYENPVPEQHSFTGGRYGAMTELAVNFRIGLAILGSSLFWAQAAWLGAGLRTLWRVLTHSIGAHAM